jgi:hypothetical protein
MLYGKAGMVGSATGFCSSTDWYEKQSESFRSELDELVAIHSYKPYSIAPDADEGHEAVMRRNFTMDGGAEIPLVIKSPGGIKGLHFTWATVTGFSGMTKKESDKLIDKLVKELYVSEYIWDAWWEKDQGDLLLFDNTIVTHNRTLKEGVDLKETIAKRFGIRSACDYQGIDYEPFYQEEYNLKRKVYMDPMNHNSHALYKHHTKLTIQSMSESDRIGYVKRFTQERLEEIMSYNLLDDPHLHRFIKHKRPANY